MRHIPTYLETYLCFGRYKISTSLCCARFKRIVGLPLALAFSALITVPTYLQTKYLMPEKSDQVGVVKWHDSIKHNEEHNPQRPHICHLRVIRNCWDDLRGGIGGGSAECTGEFTPPRPVHAQPREPKVCNLMSNSDLKNYNALRKGVAHLRLFSSASKQPLKLNIVFSQPTAPIAEWTMGLSVNGLWQFDPRHITQVFLISIYLPT